ncbi:uncharacterized protein LOC111893351 isoform X1 [Lactuca sativa]|uniref:uncharacterized protein LOC111893351 isoform X1 n=1 Tax=Lactuca sativa TaxID=4236 RepID=UPI000CD984F7|nr:uncharacterized protein LOC111893351 isoform X1 [Lactuca sativa]
MILRSSFTSWMNRLLDCMGLCCFCCSKSRPVIAVDEPSKGLRIQGRTVTKPSLSDEFWSTTTCDLDHGAAIQSQKTTSSISISTSTHSLSHFGGTGSNIIEPEFINHGLLRWTQLRRQWVDHKKSKHRTKAQEPVLRRKVTYESLLGTSKNFPRSIPLSEMVGFLVDIWEREGLNA